LPYSLAHHFHALVEGEQAALRPVDHDRDGHLVVELRCPRDDVEMTIRHRIKGAGTDRLVHA
jgi:hypothetical protein